MEFECTCHQDGQFEICETCIAEDEFTYDEEEN